MSFLNFVVVLLLLLLLLLRCCCLLIPRRQQQFTRSAPPPRQGKHRVSMKGEGGHIIVVIVCISQCATDSLTHSLSLYLYLSPLLCSSPTLRFVFMFCCTQYTYALCRLLTSAEVMRATLRYATKRLRPRSRSRPHTALYRPEVSLPDCPLVASL